MKIDVQFLNNKVGRRIFLLFIICTLVPIAALSATSYILVAGHLKNQTMARLHSSVKAHGMSIYERMLFVENSMKIISRLIHETPEQLAQDPEKFIALYGGDRFNGLGILGTDGKLRIVKGALANLPENLLEQLRQNSGSKTKIRFIRTGQLSADIYMAMPVKSDNPEAGILISQIDRSYLWGVGHENILPPMTDLFVVDQVRNILIAPFDISQDFLHKVVIKKDNSTPAYFRHEQGDIEYFISYWSLFVKSGFDAPNINIILSRPSADVLSPLDDFKTLFPLVVMLSFWIVALLSIYHIRKSMVPLERLKQGTLRIAENNFSTPVQFKSNDEFEELADAFNQMAKSLDRHFDALKTRSEIDRAILSSLNIRQIISSALKRVYTYFSCDTISISVAADRDPLSHHSFCSRDIQVRKLEEEFIRLSDQDEQLLQKDENLILKLYHDKPFPGFLPTEVTRGVQCVIAMPLINQQGLKGLITLGFEREISFSTEELNQMRQVADQVTIALSNASLVQALEKLNIGTLEALARTVDAKSAWTAGHSERVAGLSANIATVMGLESDQVETLRRGAYLHDIGKIGIPLSILDKPDRLNDEEFEQIKGHPEIGGRILEPIEAYEDVIPMISQHHERYDGTGYPKGLSGKDICLGARIMAVADVYDAVVSDRPYRDGWVTDKAVNMITQSSGTHFDPEVVDALLVALSIEETNT